MHVNVRVTDENFVPTIEGHDVSTDRYYACLEGSWNDDGDEYFGEAEDYAKSAAI